LGVKTLSALRKETTRAAAIIGHGSTTLPACAVASLAARIPFVYRQISDSLYWAPTTLRRLRVRLALRRARRVVALWPGAAEVLRQYFGVTPGKIAVIPNGVPVERFDTRRVSRDVARRDLKSFGLQPDRFTALYVGALVPEKGVDVAIDAVGTLDHVQLLVVGDGPEQERYRRRAMVTAPDRVAFVGSVQDPGPFFASADVVVLPSRGGDSMPAVLIEAGLMGRPAIATAIDAIPELVQDRRTGRIIPADDIGSLAMALAELAEDPHTAESWGRAAALRCASMYSMEVVGKAWSDMLRALL
jgi:glycosyltransferase involved in cell wall biosynthesis